MAASKSCCGCLSFRQASTIVAIIQIIIAVLITILWLSLYSIILSNIILLFSAVLIYGITRENLLSLRVWFAVNNICIASFVGLATYCIVPLIRTARQPLVQYPPPHFSYDEEKYPEPIIINHIVYVILFTVSVIDLICSIVVYKYIKQLKTKCISLQ